METPGCRHSPWKPLASPPPVSCTPAGCWELCRRETAPWGLGRPRTPTCPQFRNRLRNRRAQCKMKMRAPCSEATESFLESRALNRTRGRLPGVLADCAQSVPVAGAVTPGVRPAQSCRLPPAAHPAAPARPPPPPQCAAPRQASPTCPGRKLALPAPPESAAEEATCQGITQTQHETVAPDWGSNPSFCPFALSDGVGGR